MKKEKGPVWNDDREPERKPSVFEKYKPLFAILLFIISNAAMLTVFVAFLGVNKMTIVGSLAVGTPLFGFLSWRFFFEDSDREWFRNIPPPPF